MADLAELFARVKAQSAEGQQQQAQPSLWVAQQQQHHQQQHQQPNIASPIFSPPAQTPNPRQSTDILSPANPASTAGTPGPGQAPDLNRTNNLLNLLKFNSQSGQQQPQGQAGPMANLQNVGGNRPSSMNVVPRVVSRSSSNHEPQRPLSAADLVSNLQRNSSGQQPSPLAAGGAERPDAQRSASGNPQDFLLNLLKKPHSHAEAAAPIHQSAAAEVKQQAGIEALTQDMAQASVETSSQPRSYRESTPVRQFGSPAAATSPFEAPQPSKASMFAYRNPFDELHSSSPLNRDRTPQPEQQAQAVHAVQPKKIEILKHNRDASSNNNGDSAAPASKSRKLELEDTASMVAAQAKPHQSVSKALEGVGEEVDKQVEQALAQAGKKATVRKAAPTAGDTTNDEPKVSKENTASDGVDSSWESAEDDRQESAVEVYNFPMKPFVSLQIKATKSARPVRQDNFMVIAQLKKEFDQIDRCLVTASQAHIVYAQVATKKDNGGFRIIRQDTGDHKQVFRSSGERIFNVQLCSSPASSSDVETVLGTGVNGSVFWTSLGKTRGDLFPDDDVEGQGFVLPPVHTAEENISGSPVKTRAKMSSRHPEYFAVARGKQIYIVSPEVAKDQAYGSKDRKVDSEKLFNEHSPKINTGKAGKDFCFSEDDSVIVSLDKNGRFKFWDIRDLTARVGNATPDATELKEPLWTMNAAASGSKPEEKPSVSSIMFLDKERPVAKGAALRYMIIGFKQNHILQLWDLGLGKAVQEIRFPHEKDSDGICSISYHPKTGIVAVGHPTRNSIYFVHLSAPKYNIPAMEQAKYISMLSRNDPGLPKPESTAIMSGLREFSFAKVGQLRSVDMLRTPVENASERGTAEETLFELYTMHSKGVVGISIKRDDLGWDAQSKMINGKDGLKEGVIEVLDLQQPPKLPVSTAQSSNGDNTPKSSSKPAFVKKAEPTSQPTSSKSELKKERVHSPVPPANGLPRMASPEPPNRPLPQVPANPPLVTPESYSQTAQRAKSPAKVPATADVAEAAKTMIVSPRGSQPSLAATANADPTELQSMLDRQFGSLYQRIESDKRVTDAASSAKQDALLRLVESALTENVDRSLTNIIATRIEQDVVPTLTDVTSKVVDRKIAESLPQQLNTSVAAAMKSTLSGTLQKALQDKDVHRTISDITANAVAAKVQQQVSTMLAQNLPNMAMQASQKMIADLEKRMAQQQLSAEKQRQQDNAKIEELSSIVRSLSTTMQNMATSQSAFQEQILKMQRENKSDAQSQKSSPSADVPDPQKEAEDAEIADMTQKLVDGKYEEATIQWISSDRQAEIFDKLFVRVNPSYLQSVPPLVALTVSAAITSSFDTLVSDRLEWLGRVLSSIDMTDADIRDVAPKIMDVLSQRLQGAYMSISENTPNDPALRTISHLNKQVNEIRRLAQ